MKTELSLKIDLLHCPNSDIFINKATENISANNVKKHIFMYNELTDTYI